MILQNLKPKVHKIVIGVISFSLMLGAVAGLKAISGVNTNSPVEEVVACNVASTYKTPRSLITRLKAKDASSYQTTYRTEEGRELLNFFNPKADKSVAQEHAIDQALNNRQADQDLYCLVQKRVIGAPNIMHVSNDRNALMKKIS